MRKLSLLRRALFAAISGIGLALGMTLPASSLTNDEAARVSSLLIELSSEFGSFAYDEEEANRIYDEDQAWNGRIAAAGFSREQWKEAFDAAFRGYLATIPNTVFSTRLSAALDGLEAVSHLSTEQKKEIRGLLEEKIAEIHLLRAEGAAYADAVRPYAPQLEKAFDTGLGQ